MSTAIHVRGLRKEFGGRAVIDGLDLTVERGEIFALLGANGAGKTTTISILTTLTAPDGGAASVAGFDVRTRAGDVRRRISLTGQSAAVDDALSATENVVMFARLAGLSAAEARRTSAELLARFDLSDAAGRRVRTYSGGMRRRLDLALSFVVTPEVLFLDEPTTGLDARSRRDLWALIRAVAAAGTTVFLTTQYLEEADALADRIAVLNAGRIAATGTPAELKKTIGGNTVELRGGDGELIRRVPTDGTIASVRDALDRLDGLGAQGTIEVRHPSLDDVFLAITESDNATASHNAMKEHA